jgi:hypothetical protein
MLQPAAWDEAAECALLFPASAIVNLDHCFPAAADRGVHPRRTPHPPVRLPAWLICMHTGCMYTRSSRPGPAPRGHIYYPAGLTRSCYGRHRCWPREFECLFTRRRETST